MDVESEVQQIAEGFGLLSDNVHNNKFGAVLTLVGGRRGF